MIRLLVIADLGHASPRIPEIMEYLSKLDFAVTIYTPKMNVMQKSSFLTRNTYSFEILESTKIRMEYKRFSIRSHKSYFLTNIFKLVYKIRNIIKNSIYTNLNTNRNKDIDYKWFRQSKIDLKDKIKDFDLIFSSFSPLTAHVIAEYHSVKFKKPWIADYRDLYTLNHTTEFEARKFFYEKKLVSQAMCLITVSEGFRIQQANIYNKRIFVLNNGFSELKPLKQLEVKSVLRFFYSGTISIGYQDLHDFLDAIVLVVSNKLTYDPIFEFAGSSCLDVKDYFKKKRVAIPNAISLLGEISRNESIKRQSNSDFLIYFDWPSQKNSGVILTKFYEYMASGSCIIRFGGDGKDEVGNLFTEIGNNLRFKNKSDLVKFLINLKPGDCINLDRNDKFLTQFKYENLAKQLNSIISESKFDR